MCFKERMTNASSPSGPFLFVSTAAALALLLSCAACRKSATEEDNKVNTPSTQAQKDSWSRGPARADDHMGAPANMRKNEVRDEALRRLDERIVDEKALSAAAAKQEAANK